MGDWFTWSRMTAVMGDGALTGEGAAGCMVARLGPADPRACATATTSMAGTPPRRGDRLSEVGEALTHPVSHRRGAHACRLTLAVRPYPSLRPACLRSSYAADNPIPIKQRMASERDGWPGSPLRHSSMSCCHSSSSRKLTTGVCPIRGRPRFFRITTFESDMRRVLQQSAHTGNPVERADIVRSEKIGRASCRERV